MFQRKKKNNNVDVKTLEDIKRENEKKRKDNFYTIIELTNKIKYDTYFLDLEKQNYIIQELEDTLNKIENIKKDSDD